MARRSALLKLRSQDKRYALDWSMLHTLFIFTHAALNASVGLLTCLQISLEPISGPTSPRSSSSTIPSPQLDEDFVILATSASEVSSPRGTVKIGIERIMSMFQLPPDTKLLAGTPHLLTAMNVCLYC